MGAWTKLIAGSPERKTRLHDQQGNRVSMSSLLRNGSRAFASGAALHVFGRRPVKPWISYDAQREIRRRLTPQSRVLEYGSGMSTVWYAERAGHVLAIDDFRPWYDKVAQIIQARGIDNIDYRFSATPEDYVAVSDAERGPGFDLVMIDGSHRHRCVDTAIEVTRPGGMIYLDNADRGTETSKAGDTAAARGKLLAYADRLGCSVQNFTDFARTQMFAQKGLLIIRPE